MLTFGWPYIYIRYTCKKTKSGRSSHLGHKTAKHLTNCYYSACKTFAQLAEDIGINEGVIDYILGHSDTRRGVIRYYTRVKERSAAEALRKVAAYVAGDS